MVKFEGLLQNKYIKRLKIKYPASVGAIVIAPDEMVFAKHPV